MGFSRVQTTGNTNKSSFRKWWGQKNDQSNFKKDQKRRTQKQDQITLSSASGKQKNGGETGRDRRVVFVVILNTECMLVEMIQDSEKFLQ